MAEIDVTAQMQAGVFRIHVQEGQEIGEGDILATLDSMKMEIPVPAPVRGIVIEVVVAEGDEVVDGDVLFRISETK